MRKVAVATARLVSSGANAKYLGAIKLSPKKLKKLSPKNLLTGQQSERVKGRGGRRARRQGSMTEMT